ncbi:Dihydrolipoyllysine-residue acetyltransferase component 5 of pyruvate dehydrogenase complex [Hibiscus syriacus]|uniref:Dihydrolipoamide acetyltransferase component of pyruvate dehydrogenase complex n=1 Tax=Hibiscus syriacus TaxID=106335 RepID=A0A6A3BKI0_HIBSY|nr:dihydrolipoyllysine-residue acetyltransferase component 5 of pyruvate dehydrogenase complex, chloroplastic-like [Hibiscus syriacus]KAE8715329.1 Dihydrolipoyllysine-residue acetyltransferase component 5 of pyruvate dehydrogenase complex [Hibiscus syriacus]
MANALQTSFLPSTSSLRRTPILGSKGKSQALQVKAKIREIFMPALSSTMTEGKIVSWMKSEGDKLSKGDSVVVVESDKADMDVESFHEGFLAAIMVEEGGVAPVGSAIALLAETEDEIAEAKAKSQSSSSSGHKAVEEQPKQIEVAAPDVPAAAPVAAPPAVSASKYVALGSAVHPASEGGKRIVASPYAKKLAKELKVDLGTVVGTGPNGRIVAKDVEAAASVGTTDAAEGTVAASPAKPAPVAPGIELGKVVPFTTMQGAVSRNMVESLSVPTFRVGYTITTNALDALYKKIKSKGVTMTALLAKATALALAQHPVVNSSCRDGNSFTYNSSINIAVAVAIDGGLITPVLQDADKVDIYTLSRKWKELVDKARAKQLQHHEYSTGTFTLSNLGMFGVDRFDAILPPGTGAIMAVGASQPTVVACKDGRIGMENQMQVNVTADHRVIYGADLAAFLQTLAKIVEDPKDLTF